MTAPVAQTELRQTVAAVGLLVAAWALYAAGASNRQADAQLRRQARRLEQLERRRSPEAIDGALESLHEALDRESGAHERIEDLERQLHQRDEAVRAMSRQLVDRRARQRGRGV